MQSHKIFRTVPTVSTVPVAASAPLANPTSATAVGTNADNEEDFLPPRLELMTLAHFDDLEIAAMNGRLRGRTRYRFAFAEGGYRSYYGSRPIKGHRTPADARTTMFDLETESWVPIPADRTAPHTPEDLIEAINDVRIKNRDCTAYVHPEAHKAFNKLNASRQPNDPEMHPLRVYNLSREEEKALASGLNGTDAVYKFYKPWDQGFVRYEGSWPRDGAPNAADRRTEMWDEETENYRMLADGFTVPHDPQDYVDAVNWEMVRAEKHRRAAAAGAARQLRSANKDEKQVDEMQVDEKGVDEKQDELENGKEDDPLIESDLSGSDYSESRRDLEDKRVWHKSRGKSVTDTEEEDTRIDQEDAEEERDLEGDEEEEARSRAARSSLSTIKRSSSELQGTAPTSSDACWDEFKASFTPSQLDAASVLNSYSLVLMPPALLPELDEVSSKKPSLLEVALYPMFGEIVWQFAHRFAHLYGRSPDFVMEKANLLRKEKRAPNRYNMFKTFASRTKPEEGDHGEFLCCS